MREHRYVAQDLLQDIKIIHIIILFKPIFGEFHNTTSEGVDIKRLIVTRRVEHQLQVTCFLGLRYFLHDEVD